MTKVPVINVEIGLIGRSGWRQCVKAPTWLALDSAVTLMEDILQVAGRRYEHCVHNDREGKE